MDTRNRLSRRQFLGRSLALGAAGAAASHLAARRAQAATEATMNNPWQIGIYTRPWDAHDWRVALDAIAEAGYTSAGLMTTNSKTHLVISAQTTPDEAHTVGEECRKRGLKVPSVYGGDIPVAESLEAGIAGLKRLVDNCAACGAANLLMGGTGDPKCHDAYYNWPFAGFEDTAGGWGKQGR
ncbi:MAG TPA: twin-arginine translocation signal domain-containing protein [Phycisphaerae bacterium]|nr:twin-arginine translocation signal domain-containing protein [Phycisphaerae bacterium]